MHVFCLCIFSHMSSNSQRDATMYHQDYERLMMMMMTLEMRIAPVKAHQVLCSMLISMDSYQVNSPFIYNTLHRMKINIILSMLELTTFYYSAGFFFFGGGGRGTGREVPPSFQKSTNPSIWHLSCLWTRVTPLEICPPPKKKVWQKRQSFCLTWTLFKKRQCDHSFCTYVVCSMYVVCGNLG